MALISLSPSHLMYGQLFISQQSHLIILTLILSLKVLILQLTLVFKHLLERVA